MSPFSLLSIYYVQGKKHVLCLRWQNFHYDVGKLFCTIVINFLSLNISLEQTYLLCIPVTRMSCTTQLECMNMRTVCENYNTMYTMGFFLSYGATLLGIVNITGQMYCLKAGNKSNNLNISFGNSFLFNLISLSYIDIYFSCKVNGLKGKKVRGRCLTWLHTQKLWAFLQIN